MTTSTAPANVPYKVGHYCTLWCLVAQKMWWHIIQTFIWIQHNTIIRAFCIVGTINICVREYWSWMPCGCRNWGGSIANVWIAQLVFTRDYAIMKWSSSCVNTDDTRWWRKWSSSHAKSWITGAGILHTPQND
jgi:hypothetical protein